MVYKRVSHNMRGKSKALSQGLHSLIASEYTGFRCISRLLIASVSTSGRIKQKHNEHNFAINQNMHHALLMKKCVEACLKFAASLCNPGRTVWSALWMPYQQWKVEVGPYSMVLADFI